MSLDTLLDALLKEHQRTRMLRTESTPGYEAARAAVHARFQALVEAGNALATMPSYATHCDSGHSSEGRPELHPGCPACEAVPSYPPCVCL